MRRDSWGPGRGLPFTGPLRIHHGDMVIYR